jgi:hypothetical protein
VKEPKQISTGLARMSAMLAGKTTPDQATMPHNEFPITPTWHQLSGGDTWTDPLGGDPSNYRLIGGDRDLRV